MICVYGAGSVGCYIGGRLAATGADVVFIGREHLARQIAEHGITVTDRRGAKLRAESPRYATAPDPVAEADLVLVTVKSAATAAAGEELASRLKPGAVVISFQNGLHNAEVLAERLPGATVLPGMVAFNVVSQGEGRFHRATAGTLEVQKHADLKRWIGDFERAAIPLVQCDDMTDVQAAKLLLNLNNSINALSGLPLKTQLSRRDFRRCLAMATREALDAYAAAGLTPVRMNPVPLKWMPTILGLPDALFGRIAAGTLAIDPLARSSMWDDLEAGRPTEVDYLNGEIVALAAAHGTRAPVNARLVALIRIAEAGGRRDWSAKDLLADLRRAAHQSTPQEKDSR